MAFLLYSGDMSKLTVTEVKQEKHKLEKAIADALLQFSATTGVRVESVDVSIAETLGGEIVQYIAEVDIRL